ncbi:Hsp20/alpha crystallin family protein [Marichromatium gracile]|uniref:Heat-shock protein Hsp20 n=1 Tax=Marichromatium gracile TaxID=1048 RepID=A0ABR5VL60_MARGR|nr:Hsp20/alpha crystallin family protein [Marichromatium gracile]KXX66304.1 heat-shock protein Hsp20 [Marichromatium gracile]
MKTKTKMPAETGAQRAPTLFDEMDRAFEQMMRQGWLQRPFTGLWPGWDAETKATAVVPRMDVIDRDDEILVRAEVPGVARKDLEIELSGRLLTIRGERAHETREERGTYCHTEIARGGFTRSIRLPDEVATERVEATFEDGVLEVHLPKTERAERRRVEVK